MPQAPHHYMFAGGGGMNKLEKRKENEEQILKVKCQHFRKWEGERPWCVLVHGGEDTDERERKPERQTGLACTHYAS